MGDVGSLFWMTTVEMERDGRMREYILGGSFGGFGDGVVFGVGILFFGADFYFGGY